MQHITTIPDTTIFGTVDEIESILSSEEQKFEFKGPGLYCLSKKTIIIVPLEITNEISEGYLKIPTIWFFKQPKDMKFNVLVFNADFRNTFLTYFNQIPLRTNL